MDALTPRQIGAAFSSTERKPSVPNLAQVDWSVLDYFGWIHPAGHQGYLVIPLATGQLRGITLRRTQATSGRRRYEMCAWCHHVHRTNGTAMFSVTVEDTDERVTIGNLMCRNLDCSLRIRNLCSDPPSYMNETLDLERKVERLRDAIYQFLYRANALHDI
ncbi:MAG: hypothetical protein ACJA2J_001970 [Candidatus Azotimanducaceae bacterium]|jgi:hypothetical protein